MDVSRIAAAACLAALCAGRATAEDRRIVDDTLEWIGLESLAERPYDRLSGGQRQLVLIARAVAPFDHRYDANPAPASRSTLPPSQNARGPFAETLFLNDICERAILTKTGRSLGILADVLLDGAGTCIGAVFAIRPVSELQLVPLQYSVVLAMVGALLTLLTVAIGLALTGRSAISFPL